MNNKSLEDIFGSEDFVKGLKVDRDLLDSNYQKNNYLIQNNPNENKLYLTVTDTQTNQSELQIIGISNDYLNKNDVDKYKLFPENKVNTVSLKVNNYTKCA